MGRISILAGLNSIKASTERHIDSIKAISKVRSCAENDSAALIVAYKEETSPVNVKTKGAREFGLGTLRETLKEAISRDRWAASS